MRFYPSFRGMAAGREGGCLGLDRGRLAVGAISHALFLTRYSSSSPLYSLGRWWAMPLWQSMQVLPDSWACLWNFCAPAFWRSGAIAAKSWQLKHSREPTFVMRAHSSLARRMRLASNFAGVSTAPVNLPQISKLALILRAIL